MKRLRALVNAEFIVVKPDGTEALLQIGSTTNFEADAVKIYTANGEDFADIYLPNGDILEGVVWGPNYFENQGVPEERIIFEKEIEDEQIHIDAKIEDEGQRQEGKVNRGEKETRESKSSDVENS